MAQLNRALACVALLGLAASCTVRTRGIYEDCTQAECADGQGSCRRVGHDRDAGLVGARICTRVCESDADCPTDPSTSLPGRCVLLAGALRCLPSCEDAFDCASPLACDPEEGACLPDER